MDKFHLEEKVKDLETKVKEQTKKITELTEAARNSKPDTYALDKLKREKANAESELESLKVKTEMLNSSRKLNG